MKHANEHKAKMGLEPSLEIEAKKASGDVYNKIDKYTKLTHAAFYSGGNIEEKSTISSPNEQKKLLQRSEREIVELLLPAYNRTHSANYAIDANQPIEYDSTDVKVIDKTIGHSEEVQVTISDGNAMQNLGRNKGRLERKGESNALVQAALDKAIKKKLSYPKEARQNLILALDGWRTVKPNNLDYYREKQQQFMADSGFKEIWFVGCADETILRLFP